MRILLIRNFNPFYDASASGNRFASIIQGLTTEGVIVDLLITNGFITKQEYKSKNEYHSHKCSTFYSVKGLNYNLWLRRINNYLLQPFYLHSNKRVIKYRLRKTTYDYVWLTVGSNVLGIVEDMWDDLKVKTVIELNEFNDLYKIPGYLNNKVQYVKAYKQDQVLLRILGKVDIMMIMTNTLISYYSQFKKTTASIIHLPMTVEMKRFDCDRKATEAYIGYAGSLNNKKDGLDILLKAFAQITHEFPDTLLKLAGMYDPDIEIQKEIIRKNNLGGKVQYLGNLSRENIPLFFVNALVLTLPRPSSHQAQGGFPTKLGEYLASGRPVCITRVGEIPNYLKDGVSAFLAEPGDVDSFAHALRQALRDKKKAETIGLHGKQVAEMVFNIDIQAKRLVYCLESNLNFNND